MKPATFVFINSLVAMFSDIILNDLSKKPASEIHDSEIIHSINPYFKNKSIFVAGLYASITVVKIVIECMLISYFLFGFLVPSNTKELYYFLTIAFIVGYIADIIIEKMDIFGESLKPYYESAGAGMWGGLAISFSVIISYILQKYILPIL